MRFEHFRAHRFRYALSIAGGVLLVLVVPVPAAVESGLIGAFWNAAHAPLFTFVCFAALLLFADVGRRSQFVVLAGLCLVAAGTEYAQLYTGRGASWSDLLHNLLGIAIGFAVWKLLADARVAANRAIRSSLFGVIVVCGVLAAAPLVIAIEAHSDHERRFPVLFDANFSGVLAMTESLGELDEVAIAVEPGGITVDLLSGPRPGLVVWKFRPDWRGYAALVVDLENPCDEPFQLEIHIRDQASRSDPADWFVARATLGAHERKQLRYHLADIAGGPAGRRADLAEMSVIGVYRIAGAADRFVVRSVRLE